MKWILAVLALALAVLASGCTQAGMLAGEAGQACTTMNETYVEIDSLRAEVLGLNRQISWSQDLGYYIEGTLKLKNKDNESGWFLVTFTWLRPGETRPYTDKVNLHLGPEETGEFKSIYSDIDPQ
jgi:hypothetical protein